MRLPVITRSLTTVFVLAVLCIATLLHVPAAWADPVIKTGDSIAFLGDSITQFGASTPSGYVNLVISGLAANGIKVTAIPAGISGQTSKEMLARVNSDIISKKPTWMTMSCGVNDVWHRSVSLDEYKANISALTDQVRAAGINVMILTSTMIHEDQADPLNQQLVAYNNYLHQLAGSRSFFLADLNADMQAQILAARKTLGFNPPYPNFRTVDGVHMNTAGNIMMATGILRAFGLSDTQLQTARKAWLDIPNAVVENGRYTITIRQYLLLNAMATQKHVTYENLMTQIITPAINAVVSPSPAGR